VLTIDNNEMGPIVWYVLMLCINCKYRGYELLDGYGMFLQPGRYEIAAVIIFLFHNFRLVQK
jgi:hypothetical protein